MSFDGVGIVVLMYSNRIETLLEEAFNERMHLLTFLKLAEPSWFMKVMILGAQGTVPPL